MCDCCHLFRELHHLTYRGMRICLACAHRFKIRELQ